MSDMIVDGEYWGVSNATIKRFMTYSIVRDTPQDYKRPWVAKITGRSKSFGYTREFVKPRYFKSLVINSKCIIQRTEFHYETQAIYEFKNIICTFDPFEQTSGFVLVLNDGLTRISRERVAEWLHMTKVKVSEDDIPF